MRRYLIDYARGRPDADFVAIEAVMDFFPADKAEVDLTITADALGMKLRTMQRMWCDTRQWLFEHKEFSNARKSAGR
jgi:hypothetical protein